MPEIVKEMGAGGFRNPPSPVPYPLPISGGGFLVKFKVGAFPATLAAPQKNRLLSLSGRCYGLKHGATIALRAW